jgi:hypothetical protein
MHKKKCTYDIVAYDKDADVYVRIATIHHDISLAIACADRASELHLKRSNGEPFDWIEVITPYAGVRHYLVPCK